MRIVCDLSYISFQEVYLQRASADGSSLVAWGVGDAYKNDEQTLDACSENVLVILPTRRKPCAFGFNIMIHAQCKTLRA